MCVGEAVGKRGVEKKGEGLKEEDVGTEAGLTKGSTGGRKSSLTSLLDFPMRPRSTQALDAYDKKVTATMEDKIKENAELVLKQMRQVSGIDFGYDAESIAWLDGYIERQRARTDITQELVQGLVNVFGSYLGECVIKCYGGYWEIEEGHWRVSFNENNALYPFSKVQKQFENGSEDSIKSFFDIIPTVFVFDIKGGDTDKKAWWKIW